MANESPVEMLARYQQERLGPREWAEIEAAIPHVTKQKPMPPYIVLAMWREMLALRAPSAPSDVCTCTCTACGQAWLQANMEKE